MAKKKDTNKELLDLKKEIEEKTILIGAKEVLKQLKTDKLSRIYLANNCPEKTRAEVNYYAGLSKVPVTLLDMSNEELGSLCKKHFFISVLGIKKR